MSIHERILYLVELKGYNKNSFCIKTGIKPQTLHHIISGRKTKPSFNVIEKILSTFADINSKWLITGLGEPIINKLNEVNLIYERPDEFNLLFSECKYKDYKVLEMTKKINDLKQQITELQEDKDDLRTALRIIIAKIENDSRKS